VRQTRLLVKRLNGFVKTRLARPLIEGLARLIMVLLYARQAGSFRFVMTTCRAHCENNFEPDHKGLELLPIDG